MSLLRRIESAASQQKKIGRAWEPGVTRFHLIGDVARTAETIMYAPFLILFGSVFVLATTPALAQVASSTFNVGITITSGTQEAPLQRKKPSQGKSTIYRNPAWSKDSRFTCSAGRSALEKHLALRLSPVSCAGATFTYATQIKNKSCAIDFNPLSGGFTVDCS